MVILDTALRKRAADGNPIRVAMIGAGFMARGIANQIINSVPGMRLVGMARRKKVARQAAPAVAAHRQPAVHRHSPDDFPKT